MKDTHTPHTHARTHARMHAHTHYTGTTTVTLDAHARRGFIKYIAKKTLVDVETLTTCVSKGIGRHVSLLRDW